MERPVKDILADFLKDHADLTILDKPGHEGHRLLYVDCAGYRPVIKVIVPPDENELRIVQYYTRPHTPDRNNAEDIRYEHAAEEIEYPHPQPVYDPESRMTIAQHERARKRREDHEHWLSESIDSEAKFVRHLKRLFDHDHAHNIRRHAAAHVRRFQAASPDPPTAPSSVLVPTESVPDNLPVKGVE